MRVSVLDNLRLYLEQQIEETINILAKYVSLKKKKFSLSKSNS